MKEKRADIEWLWHCCECGCGANSALLIEYCPSCQKHRCSSCAMSPRPSKERRQKQKKGATNLTGVAPSKTGATGTNADLRGPSPSAGEAQHRPCRTSHSDTPSSTGASPPFGSFAHTGGSGLTPTSDYLLDSPNGAFGSPDSASFLSIEPTQAASVAGSHGPTSPHVNPEALLSNLHHEALPTESPYEPPLPIPDCVCEALPPLTFTETLDTIRTTSPSPPLFPHQDTPVPPSRPQDYCHPLHPSGNIPIGISSPSDILRLNNEPDLYLYDHEVFPEMCLHEEIPTSSHPPNVDHSNDVSRPLPGNPTARSSSMAVTKGALMDEPALAKQPKHEAGVLSKSPGRHGLPSSSNKRKWEPMSITDEGQRHHGFPSYDATLPHHENNLACPFYKMNPKQYMGCGERSIGNISALGQHIKNCHKLKPHSCRRCFQPHDDEASLCRHRERGQCRATGGCAVDDLGPVPRKCKGQRETWLWYWKKLFPFSPPPASPYTDGLEVVGQFALFAIENVLSASPVEEPLKSELIRRMLMAANRWRADPSAPLDHSEFSNHMHSDIPANRDYVRGHWPRDP